MLRGPTAAETLVVRRLAYASVLMFCAWLVVSPLTAHRRRGDNANTFVRCRR